MWHVILNYIIIRLDLSLMQSSVYFAQNIGYYYIILCFVGFYVIGMTASNIVIYIKLNSTQKNGKINNINNK